MLEQLHYPYQVEDLHLSDCCYFLPTTLVHALPSPGHSVRFADMPGKSRKKKKNMKELTPLQAMMLRMAGE